MRWGFKSLWIWLLVCCVPAQVAAAATMALCGASHPAVAVGHGDQRGEHTAHAHHADADHTAHGHHHAEPAADSHDTQGHGAQGNPHKCSACASCCGAAAMLSTALQMHAPPFDPPAFVAVVPAVAHFAADGPDRPPRRMHA